MSNKRRRDKRQSNPSWMMGFGWFVVLYGILQQTVGRLVWGNVNHLFLPPWAVIAIGLLVVMVGLYRRQQGRTPKRKEPGAFRSKVLELVKRLREET